MLGMLAAGAAALLAAWYVLLWLRVPQLKVLGGYWFGATTALGLSAAWLCIKVAGLVLDEEAMKPPACRLANLAFRFALAMNPQISVTTRGLAFEDLPDKCVILMNHTSWLDSVIIVGSVPNGFIPRMRTLLKSTLMDLPIGGVIFKGAGHFPVHFKKDAEGSWEVDKVRQAEVTEKMQTFLKRQDKSILCFYPEGVVNKTPQVLASFRRGSFQMPLDMKLPVYSFLMVNNELSWPAGGLPGNPADIKTSLSHVCDTDKLPADINTAAALSEYCHGKMQAELDELRGSTPAASKKMD